MTMVSWVNSDFKDCVKDLKMPIGWSDISYGNDVCPSWTYNGFQVMILNSDPQKREDGFETELRFNIFRAVDYGDHKLWTSEVDTFDEVLQVIGDEMTWHSVARAFMERHSPNAEPCSLEEYIHTDHYHELHPTYQEEANAIIALFFADCDPWEFNDFIAQVIHHLSIEGGYNEDEDNECSELIENYTENLINIHIRHKATPRDVAFLIIDKIDSDAAINQRIADSSENKGDD